jgi:hypothetical protein
LLPYAPAGVVLILAGFLASRAALSDAGDPKELKAQKWLLYPSLLIVYVSVLLALLTWPVGLLFSLAEGYEHTFMESSSRLNNETDYWVMAVSVTLAGLGLWWNVLAAVVLKPRRLFRVLFMPFADAFKPKWALWLLLIGLVLMVLSAGTGIIYYRSCI